MNKDRFNEIVDKTIKDTGELLVKKNAEYASSTDVLANFKRNAERNGQTVLECWQVYWNKHIDAIHSYILRVKERAVHYALLDVVALDKEAMKADDGVMRHRATDPKWFQERVAYHLSMAIRTIDAELSESIEGRFDDNINYSILCKAILEELRGSSENQGVAPK